MPTLYVETSIVSYLREQPSSRVVAAARQILTRRWWECERGNYDLVTSQYVIDEAGDGDHALARERLALLAGIPLLPVIPEMAAIADEILAREILPPSAAIDALHISVVAHHRIEYLLTWNCAHLANARNLPRVYRVLDDLGLPRPIICTPEEMLPDEAD